MDDKFRDILEGLPGPEFRSRLDPFRELIDELRRRGRTYREIAHILADRCEVLVSVSTVYRFIQSRSLMKQKVRERQLSQSPKMKELRQTLVLEEMVSTNSLAEYTANEIKKRISDIKFRQAPATNTSELFHYDPDEPLHLPSKAGKTSD